MRRDEIPPGTLYLLILKTLSLYGPLHGYEMADSIQQSSEDILKVEEGSLYPALYRLEDRGWLQSKWEETETGREAKFYSITRAGRKRLGAEMVNWERLSEAVALILRTVE